MLAYVRRHKGEIRVHELLFQFYYRIAIAALHLRSKEESWRILLLSHDSVSMLRGSDSLTPVAVVICLVLYFGGFVCEELKHIRLCLCLVCSGVS